MSHSSEIHGGGRKSLNGVWKECFSFLLIVSPYAGTMAHPYDQEQMDASDLFKDSKVFFSQSLLNILCSQKTPHFCKSLRRKSLVVSQPNLVVNYCPSVFLKLIQSTPSAIYGILLYLQCFYVCYVCLTQMSSTLSLNID